MADYDNSDEARERLIESVKRGALSIDVPLRFEVLHLNSPLKKLTMRRPTVGDVIDSGRNATPEQSEINLLARLTELGPDTIRKLDWADYALVQEVLVAFRS